MTFEREKMISKITAKNQRILLGLSLGEVSTVALWVDGEIISCVSEERFTRRKNDEAYPKNAIEFILNSNKISANDVERILIAGLELNATTHLLRTYSSWSIKDQLRMMHKFWYPKLYENKEADLYSLFEDKIDVDQYPGLGVLKKKLTSYFSKGDWPVYKSFLHDTIAEHLGISVDKILHLDHHTCHAAYAYWGGHVRGEDSLIITADAYGDGLSSTISVLNKNGTLQRVHAVPHDQFTIGRIYRYITLLLGMKPNGHEYKVMGLAPYAKEEILKPAFEVFNKTLKIDGIDFKFGEKPIDNYFWFRERLEGLRFDAIAGGLQRFTENILLTYTKNALQKFSKRKLAYSGGVSMNIKAKGSA
jgi:carbamoyltransferase